MDDLISRQALCEYALNQKDKSVTPNDIMRFPSAQPEYQCGECDAWNQYKNYSRQHWIPCSERLPEEPYGCLVTVWDTNPITMDEFENILPYFVGWDGEQWNDADGEQCPFEVIAWMPLPEPYQEERRTDE